MVLKTHQFFSEGFIYLWHPVRAWVDVSPAQSHCSTWSVTVKQTLEKKRTHQVKNKLKLQTRRVKFIPHIHLEKSQQKTFLKGRTFLKKSLSHLATAWDFLFVQGTTLGLALLKLLLQVFFRSSCPRSRFFFSVVLLLCVLLWFCRAACCGCFLLSSQLKGRW